MANTLTNLAADIYKAADVVGRELVGIIPSITINGDASERAARGGVIRSHFTRTPVVNTTYAPAMTIPEGTDQVVDNKTLVINQFASVQIPWEGEEIKHVNNGSGYETIYGDQIAQAMRAITNRIESYAHGVIRAGASRAIGTAGTTPFGTNFNEVAQVRQILVDNGMPMTGQETLVLNTLAGTNLRNLAQLQKANEAGSSNLLRQGELLNLQGLMLKESAGVVAIAAGAGTGYLVNNGAGYPIGATSIVVDTGTGTILAGDTVTFAGHTDRYVVETGIAGAGTLVLAAPGLRVAVADNVAITRGATATANLAFTRSAIELVCRPVAVPAGGDAATDVMTVQDPVSGLVYDMSVYKGYKKAMMEVSCLYDVRAWKSNHIAQLLG